MSQISDHLRSIAYQLGISNSARTDQCIAEDVRKNPQDFVFADRVLTAQDSEPTKTSRQRYQLADLGRLLEKHRPMSILEIGSGATTAVFADYARKAGARVVSVDESEKWAGHARDLLVKMGLEKHVEFMVCPKRIDTDKMEASYQGMPKEPFEFVLVDGPALQLDGVQHRDVVCADIFDLPPPKVIVVDKRVPTVKALRERMGDRYSAQISDLIAGTPHVGLSYFSVFSGRS